MKKKLLACLLAALCLVGMAGGESAEIQERGETLVPVLELPELPSGQLVEIPLDQNSQKISIPPVEEGYLYAEGEENPYGYVDPSITVNIGTGRRDDTNYIYARVKIASASQLRTLMASPVGHQSTTPGHDLAKRVQAVLAINGDWPGGDSYTKRAKGALMRQGKLLRKVNCDGKWDVLVIDGNGDLKILPKVRNADVEAAMEDAVQIFTFGPGLVIDGQPNEDLGNIDIGMNKQAQRMAICQTGPLEYLLLTTEGPEDPGSVGMTVPQFVELISSFPEVINAYNLDGGSSSTMVFRKGGKNWRKINAPNNTKIRPLKDIIYFASAWEQEDSVGE